MEDSKKETGGTEEFSTSLEDLKEFMKQWNNDDEVENGSKPFNPYNMGAIFAGFGFTLKWFVSQTDFDKLVKDLEYELDKENQTRMLLEYGEDRIEIEVDNRGILQKVHEDTQGIRDIFDKVEKEHKK